MVLDGVVVVVTLEAVVVVVTADAVFASTMADTCCEVGRAGVTPFGTKAMVSSISFENLMVDGFVVMVGVDWAKVRQ